MLGILKDCCGQGRDTFGNPEKVTQVTGHFGWHHVACWGKAAIIHSIYSPMNCDKVWQKLLKTHII